MTRMSFARGAHRWCLLALGAMLALATGPAPARAQQPAQNSGNQDEPVRPPRARTFQLFGLADFAITGLRQGGRTSWKTTASGPSDDAPTLDSDLSGRVIGTPSSRNGYCCGYFELQLWAAAARGDWSRARDQIPSLENVRGGGWNSRTQLSRWVTDQNQLVWQGRDASIGDLFSGVTSTNDGSCRDNSRRANANIGVGLQLLAGSDCPPTWAGSTFEGERVVADTTWLNDFRLQGQNFTWDDWRYGADRRDPDRLYGSFQTFGVTNDFGREVRINAGSVIPGGAGAPKIEGYPLGIQYEWNVWTYSVPSLGDAMFYKANIVNKSADVYGVGIDYDSLFLGFMVRPFHTTGTQAPAVYADPSRGTVLSAQQNVNGVNCYGPAGGKTLGTDIRGCGTANRGFNGGAGGLVVLKSPIGDLRNKLFSNPASPYFLPSHPLAGDTITFNLMASCGFTCAQQQVTPGRVRAVYGAITGDVANALAGRGVTAGELTERQYHDLVRNPDWPARYSPSAGTQGGFATYVPPGGWDYNKDGVLDTMKVTTCWTSAHTAGYTGTPVDGCVPPFADTLPGGFPNNFHNNYWAGVGPIKLAAGDTTSYIVAFVSVPDSISLEQQVTSINQLYLDFWLSPQPPEPVQIVSASVVGGSRQFDTSIRLFLDQAPNAQSDRFVLEAARKLKTSEDPADRRLRTLNPTLVNDIRARALPAGTAIRDTVAKDTARANAGLCTTPSNTTFGTTGDCLLITSTAVGVVDSVLVFKSCDGGTTYTASTAQSCPPSPARDAIGAAPSGYSWQSYARLGRDASGQFPSQFVDGSVTGGVTYTYVFISQSYPVAFNVIDIVNGAPAVREYLVRRKTQNGLTANTANKNVATVYVPASTQAGGAAANVRFDNFVSRGFTTGDTSAAVNAFVRLSRPVRGGQPIAGRAIFSDSAVVTVVDLASTPGVDTTIIELYELAADSINGTTVGRRSAGRTERFVVNGRVDLAFRSNASTSSSTTSGGVTRTRYDYRFTAFGRPQVTFLLDGVPQYVTDSIPSGSDLTPAAALARADFGGALLTLTNPTFTGTPAASYWRAPGIPVLRAGANPTIRWLSATSRDSLSFGRYRIEFVDSEFGPLAPFRYDRLNPQAVRDRYTQSLGERDVASTTVTTAEAAQAIGRALSRPAITVDSLATLSLPFTVRNLRFGGDVQVAVLKAAHPATAVLGIGNDTVRVPVPADRWIPGDDLYLIENLPTYAYDTLSTSPLIRRLRRNAAGEPDIVSTLRVTWGPARLGCDVPASPVTPAQTCNPLEGFAASGYTLAGRGLQYDLQWYAPIRGLQSLEFTLLPERAGDQIATVPEGDLGNVRAVPNPYVMFSEYEQTPGTKRMMFVGLPPRGTIRIYTASGQFVQRIQWTEDDLERNCSATTVTTACIATGDLTWNMRSRENKEIGPGFYMFVVSTDVGGKREKIGKFVVIH